MAKSSKAVEIIEDSEEEEIKLKKNAKDAKATKSKSASESAGNSDEENEEEEEYEIEAIIDAKNNAFPNGRMGYLVKWKGYDESQNSWVDEQDADNAKELIDEFWARRRREQKEKGKLSKVRAPKSEPREESVDDKASSASTKRKKTTGGRKSKSAQVNDDEGVKQVADDEDDEAEKPRAKKAKTAADKVKNTASEVKKPRARSESSERDEMEVDQGITDYKKPSESLLKLKSWEAQIQSVDTIENIDGNLTVFFTLKNGDKLLEKSSVCAKHFPQKLISFYESHLRWKEIESTPSS